MRKPSSIPTAPSQTGLTSSLKRLITNPRRFGTVNLWKALTPDERMAAATSYLAEEADARETVELDASREPAIFGPPRFRRWPEEKSRQGDQACSAQRRPNGSLTPLLHVPPPSRPKRHGHRIYERARCLPRSGQSRIVVGHRRERRRGAVCDPRDRGDSSVCGRRRSTC